MTPRAAHDALTAFRPLTSRHARLVLDNPNAGWAPGTEDEARGVIAADAARLGGNAKPHPDRVIETRRPVVPQDHRMRFTALDLFIGLLIGLGFFPAVRLLMNGLAMLAEVAR